MMIFSLDYSQIRSGNGVLGDFIKELRGFLTGV